ncbi:hypothetical protein S40288_10660 [Stachybotrys chartarum IBT 40288]|nr:hypothetical protein S40288_10660 [Stachybotrys chartarum IBT 40288]
MREFDAALHKFYIDSLARPDDDVSKYPECPILPFHVDPGLIRPHPLLIAAGWIRDIVYIVGRNQMRHPDMALFQDNIMRSADIVNDLRYDDLYVTPARHEALAQVTQAAEQWYNVAAPFERYGGSMDEMRDKSLGLARAVKNLRDTLPWPPPEWQPKYSLMPDEIHPSNLENGRLALLQGPGMLLPRSAPVPVLRVPDDMEWTHGGEVQSPGMLPYDSDDSLASETDVKKEEQEEQQGASQLRDV